MHCLNLGLLWTCNGGVLILSCLGDIKIMMCCVVHTCVDMLAQKQTRMTLLELGYFGDPAVPLKIALPEARHDFRIWCQLNGVHTGQGRFTVGLAARLIKFFLSAHRF